MDAFPVEECSIEAAGVAQDGGFADLDHGVTPGREGVIHHNVARVRPPESEHAWPHRLSGRVGPEEHLGSVHSAKTEPKSAGE